MKMALHRWILPGVLLFACAGCAVATQQGDATVYHFSFWTPLLVAVGGVLAAVIGLLGLWTRRLLRLGIVLLVTGTAACVLAAPAMLGDQVKVSPTGFSVHTGFWWAPSHYEVKFADLARIDLAVAERSSRQRMEYDLICHRKDGGMERVPVTTLMKQGATTDILQTAKKLGIAVTDAEGGHG